MKKYLPIILFTSLILAGLARPISLVLAQAPPAPAASTPAFGGFGPSPGPGQTTTQSPCGAEWCPDDEVTFVGKIASRSKDLLNWVIANHEWSSLNLTNKPADQANKKNPFDAIYFEIKDTVLVVLALFILAGAFLMIVTRGQSLTIKRFAIRFALVLFGVLFAFSIINFLYWMFDWLQGVLLSPNKKLITDADLLSISFNYSSFLGYRRFGPQFDESAFISLLLIKLTAATYYAMFIILIVRKVILWFFIIVSPIFPVLWLFSPLRNSAKIWLGEFFRWLLYGPLFAVFLGGIVLLWQTFIPLNLDYTNANSANNTSCDPKIPYDTKQSCGVVYPTAINILIGGPGQKLSFSDKQVNNVSNSQTFIEYVVALIMLWMVIIMPFILLKIFLDYFYGLGTGDNKLLKYIAKAGNPLLERYGPKRNPPPVNPIGPVGPLPSLSAGMAKNLEYTSHAAKQAQSSIANLNFATNQAAEAARSSAQAGANLSSVFNKNVASSSVRNAYSATPGFENVAVGNLATDNLSTEILSLTNLSIPTMADVAKYEAAVLTTDAQNKEQVSQITESLSRIAGESRLTTPAEQQKYSQVRSKLTEASAQGNAIATSIKSAISPEVAILPQTNQVQTVNLEDYEKVKQTWKENYKKLEPPLKFGNSAKSREEWIQEDIKQIPMAIDLLLSGDPNKQKQGKQMVSKILPFLLLGGFSQAEIVAYLKAKLAAAKEALKEVLEVQENEENKVAVANKPQAVPKQMLAAEPLPEEGSKPPSSQQQ